MGRALSRIHEEPRGTESRMRRGRARLEKSFNGLLRFWTRNCWKGEKWQDEEVDRLASSHGSWPGHEVDYMTFNRVLWQMGREEKSRTEEEGKAKGRS